MTDPPATPFWDWLTIQLKTRGLSATRFARRQGVSTRTLTRWKRGALPGPDSARKLADAFGVPLWRVYALCGIATRARHELEDPDLPPGDFPQPPPHHQRESPVDGEGGERERIARLLCPTCRRIYLAGA